MPADKDPREAEPRVVVTDDRGRPLPDQSEGTVRQREPDRRDRRAALTERSQERADEPRRRDGRTIEDDRPSERQTRQDRRFAALRRQIGDRDSRIAMLENDLRLTTGRLAAADTASMTHYEAAAKARLEQWQEKLAQAHEAGDFKAIAEATRQVSSAQFALDNIELAKARTPAATGRRSGEPGQRQERQPAVAAPSQRTQEWIDAHPWFNTDRDAHEVVIKAHNAVIRAGIKVDTDEYFDEVERLAEPLLPEGYVDPPYEPDANGHDLDRDPPARRRQARDPVDDELDAALDDDPPPRRHRTSRQSADDFADGVDEPTRRAPVGGVRRGQANRRDDGPTVRLTQAEMQTCAELQITPAQYARNRAKLAEDGKIGPNVR